MMDKVVPSKQPLMTASPEEAAARSGGAMPDLLAEMQALFAIMPVNPVLGLPETHTQEEIEAGFDNMPV